ncbi:MAG TPA: plastocyanin/azurin family copper-binding protein [Ktedonobacteraceae bacterium]|nr:plastocyanin/azurin family copper-binding protein [Ktedonobacteraceae bacterium]
MNRNIITPTTIFCLLMLGALVLLAACGSNSTTTASSPTTSTATSNPAPTATTGGNTYGRYGSGGSTTPTATTAPTGATQTVTITTDSSGQFAFSPKSLTISVGTTVIWKNTTQAPHTVTSNDGKSFNTGDSTPVAPGSTFSFKFTKAGTFAYHCNFHPFMTATLIVK